MMRNARWASLHSSMGMGEPPWSFAKPVGDVMLASAQMHDRLQPYLYSQAVHFSQDGYPWTMTPLPIAFPNDRQAVGRENAIIHGYEWMIGDALLATALYGDDCATAQTRDVYLPAGAWMDFDTGELYQGPRLLKGFALPVEKTPLFVGGSGILIEKQHQSLVACVYPVSKRADEEFFLPGSSGNVKIRLAVNHWKQVRAIDMQTGRAVAGNWQGHAYTFAIRQGHTYRIRSEER
jgi:alpha-D-xyloside xylohydrolase